MCNHSWKIKLSILAGILLAIVFVISCTRGDGGAASKPSIAVPGKETALKNAADVRAQRRAYDGAPPAIPHKPFQMTCVECHNSRGMSVDGVGFSPPSPHESTAGLSLTSRCQQCHVYAEVDSLFVESDFSGLPQNLRHGERLHPLAPPVMPHSVFMRENCAACHSGAAAREEVRCTHPERTRCLQCHASQANLYEDVAPFTR